MPDLADGIDFAVLAMGVFGIAEILRNLENPEARDVVRSHDRPAAALGRRSAPRASWPIVRGTGLGAVLGILPGNGAVLAPFASYTLEKKLADDPSRFGKGAIEGVAGPEAANNAGAQTAFIPLLTLGIPPNAVMALMVGAMTIHGVIPGPQVMTKNPNLFWGMIASMWIGNLMLLVINLPLIGLWVRLLKVPYRLHVHHHPAVLLHRHLLDQQQPGGRVLHGLLRLRRLRARSSSGSSRRRMLLGFVLGRLMEEKLRQALALSRRQLHDLRRAAGLRRLLLLALAVMVIAVLPAVRKSREEAFQE